MGYVNVSLPSGEGRVFKIPPRYWEKMFTELTVDEDKDAVLFEGQTDRENPENLKFYFYYKGIITSFGVYRTVEKDEKTCVYHLRGMRVWGDLDEEEVLAEIREALKVYGWFGMPLERQEMYKRKFNRQNPNGFAEVDF